MENSLYHKDKTITMLRAELTQNTFEINKLLNVIDSLKMDIVTREEEAVNTKQQLFAVRNDFTALNVSQEGVNKSFERLDADCMAAGRP